MDSEQSNHINYLGDFNPRDWDFQQSDQLFRERSNHHHNHQNNILINPNNESINNNSRLRNLQYSNSSQMQSSELNQSFFQSYGKSDQNPFIYTNFNKQQQGLQIYLGSLSSYCIGYNIPFKYTKVLLEHDRSKYYLTGKQPIQLIYNCFKSVITYEQQLQFQYQEFKERKQQCQIFLRSINFPTSLIKQNTLLFQPMYINCWKLLTLSKEVRLQFSTNMTKDHKVGSLLVPIKIDIYLKQNILNEKSSFDKKNYVQIIKEYQILKQESNQCKNILQKLQKKSQQIFYNGQKYSTPSDFYGMYEKKTDAFRHYKRSEVQQAKVVRLFILHLIQKLKVNILNRSFIKPRPKMNYFINWFLIHTIGKRISNLRKYKLHMLTYLTSDEIKLLIQTEKDYLQYYKENLQNSQIQQQQISQEKQLNFPKNIFKNWINNQIYQFKNTQLNINNKKQNLRISYVQSQTLTEYQKLLKQEKQKQIKSQLGLVKQNQNKQNQEIEQQNLKLLKQFEKQNKYFKVHQTPAHMNTKLHDYQGQALQWMKYRQGKLTVEQLFQQTYLDEKQDNFEFQRKLSPFWSQLQLKDGQTLYVNYVTGEITKKFHPWKTISGGILADEMGLGKTVMTISLLVDDNFKGLNLIVVPVNVVKQWVSQLKTHCKKQIKIFQYHQNAYRRKQNLQNYDVIITTYGTLGNEEKAYKYKNAKQKKQGGQKFLFDYQFRRVILDQAQNIKCPTTLQFQGAYRLKTQFKWCLTGTVVQNTQQDLFAIFKFLDVQVFSQEYWWNSYIKRCQNQAEKFNIIYTVLRPLLLRRTKQSTSLDGRVILTLPPRKQYVKRPHFTQQEAKIYEQLQNGIRLYFNQMTQKMKKSYTHVFQILSRLRQFCCHPSLIFKKRVQDIKQQDIKSFLEKFIKVGSQVFKNQTIEKLLEEDQQMVCPICQENPKQQSVITACGHIYCESCLKALQKRTQQNCAVCRKRLNGQFFRKSLNKEKQIKSQINNILEGDSSKVKAVIATLKQIAEKKQKCVIFSQWVKIIEILKRKMDQMSYKWVSITGDMSKNQRSKSVSDFKEDNDCFFMIVSLRAGGTGLNLTMANNVIICDPWWNPAHQDQAIHRVHRIGQQKQVYVYRFFMKDSIQQKIQKMHIRKRKLADKVMMRNPKEVQNQKKQTQQMIEMIICN